MSKYYFLVVELKCKKSHMINVRVSAIAVLYLFNGQEGGVAQSFFFIQHAHSYKVTRIRQPLVHIWGALYSEPLPMAGTVYLCAESDHEPEFNARPQFYQWADKPVTDAAGWPARRA
ncbi:hypothetical protein GCM10027578_05470 [Spirosoma luteolum]